MKTSAILPATVHGLRQRGLLSTAQPNDPLEEQVPTRRAESARDQGPQAPQPLLAPDEAEIEQQKELLQGHQLSTRWAHRSDFVMLDTDFALGQRFLLSWQAWLRCPQRSDRLCFVAVAPHPPLRADLSAAWLGLQESADEARQPPDSLRTCFVSLLEAWPTLTPNLHVLEFDQGSVRLLLALGPLRHWLPALRLQADAIHLHAQARKDRVPAELPDLTDPSNLLGTTAMNQLQGKAMLKALGRLALPGASLVSSACTSEHLKHWRSAGFVARPWPVAASPDFKPVLATFEPRRHGRALTAPARDAALDSAPDAAAASQAVHVVVVGAGVAGAAVARALAQQGAAVTVLEQHAQVAREGSGVPAALFHGTLHRDDNRYARLLRAAALQARRDYVQAMASGAVAGQTAGLMRLGSGRGRRDPALLWAAMLDLKAQSGLPDDWVRPLSSAEVSARAGVPIASPAWFYPGGGWVALPEWVRFVLQDARIRVRTGYRAASLQRNPDPQRSSQPNESSAAVGTKPVQARWSVLDDQGKTLAEADHVVLANTGSAQALLGALGHPPWPLQQSRGQLSLWPLAQPCALRLPITGGGYVLQAHGTGADMLIDTSTVTGALPAQRYLVSGATDQPLPWRDVGASGAPKNQSAADDLEGSPWPGLGSALRSEDHQHNLQRLRDLIGPEPLEAAAGSPQGWAGARLRSADRLPIAGPIAGLIAGPITGPITGQIAGQVAGSIARSISRPIVGQAANPPSAEARAMAATSSRQSLRLGDLRREAGLFVLTALGSRGATFAPLLGRLVAAQVLNRPLPLEADLVEALDPGRWQIKAARRA